MLMAFRVPILISIVAIGLFGVFMGLDVMFTVMVLAVLEISLSIDNAVVNASVLKGWDHKWRQIFLVFGLPVAVFGMRLVFPLLIVGLSSGMLYWTSDVSWYHSLTHVFGLWDVLSMALSSPEKYHEVLMASHEKILAFGGSFLALVFLKFFMDKEKDVHWIKFLERPLQTLSKLEEAFVLLLVVLLSSYTHDPITFILAGIFGVITHVVVEKLGSLGEGGADQVVKQGIGGFMYLEILDASFSFDGVIGAFALSTNIFVIAGGLGIGALFVRELTIYLVEKGTMDAYKYLEHGAFWAIGALASVMFIDLVYEVPEVVTGLASAVILALSIWSSVLEKRKQQAVVTV